MAQVDWNISNDSNDTKLQSSDEQNLRYDLRKIAVISIQSDENA